MELKEYQQKSLDQVRIYLQLLSEWKKKADENPDLEIDFPEKAWEKTEVGRSYFSRKNGLGQLLPNFCLKIPTGGGKTFLAVKTIDLINTIYRKRRTGLILWIVPTNQIYNQTIINLRNREHPYRQHLDIASSGRTLILEKSDYFTPLDIEENLVVLMLMLPSANRRTKETLKVFKDNGGFQSFFPPEDQISQHEELLKRFPNLDTYGDKNSFWQRQIKTSLGNTLRILSPVIILDEGHKAYSEGAQETLRGFNPSIIVELSATPPDTSNKLVDIKGIELSREEMIKLDLHIINKANPDWKDTLLASVEKRNFLEDKAKEYGANTGNDIRPICLIQVERTGRDQRGSRFIHSEDVREYLTKIVGIPDDQVAVTSAELKEIEGIDLLGRDCRIRYIITKQALQEGWDCAFAYILTILTNPSSINSLTQLVGRILRQPNARKTKVKDLDESYVFTFQQKATQILTNIKDGFEDEGLGDLSGRVIEDEMLEEEIAKQEQVFEVRDKFRTSVKKTVLPVFVFNVGRSWRPVNYDVDIESRIDWTRVHLEPMFTLALSKEEETNIEMAVRLSKDEKELIEQQLIGRDKEGGLRLDAVFLTRHLLEIVPNPWIAYDLGEQVLLKLLNKYDDKIVVNNFVFIIEELKKHLLAEKDRLAKLVFNELIAKDLLRFMVISSDLGFQLPKKKSIKTTSRKLRREDGEPLQYSLFDFVPEEELNEMEKAVAWYLEDQSKLFFWYRNVPRQDYAVQGWRRQKIYADFIFTTQGKSQGGYNKVFVVETKGIHLKNEDTDYKKTVFDICNEQAEEGNLSDLGFKWKNTPITFEVLFGDEWERRLNALLV